ncbi:MAG: Crp/Fnr family transcriptional regulator [Clostridia bacterium]|nr:Crp/Fnr family transcriptional regulator [Clostridia bacterium]
MKKYLEILSKCALFDGIDAEDLLRMLSCLGARVLSFDKKYTVLAEGAEAKCIGILLSGSLHEIQIDYYGNRSIIGRVRPSEMFSEEFACAEMPALPITVVANEPSEVMLVDCSHIIRTCKNGCGFHHRLIFNLMKALATRSIGYHKRIEITSKRSTREKLLTYLALYAKEVGSPRFEIPFDRQELADYLEVERSGLSAEISKLRREGVIKSEKNKFMLLKGD